MEIVASLLLCFVIACASAAEDHMETAFAVTRCRAACLDQHSRLIRTVDTCWKKSDCKMCWDTCELLNKNFEIWGPMCSVPDICFPGCQTACKSIPSSNTSSFNNSKLPTLAVKSVFDFSTMRVMIEWMPNESYNTDGSVLYTVLIRNKDEEEWHQVVQTTSHVVHLRNKMVFRDTAIRVLAANASDMLYFADTTYADSLSGPKSPVYMSENGWTPQLVSMEKSETSSGMLATITWPKIPSEFGPNEYEVSWNVVDNSMEITGHLMTTKNMAVLTLWPESIYLIQVNRYTSSGVIYGDTSEVLVIDTKVPYLPTLLKSTPTACKHGKEKTVANTVTTHSFIVAMILLSLALFWVILLKSKLKTDEESYNRHINILADKIKVLYHHIQGQFHKKLPGQVKQESTTTESVPQICCVD